MIGVPIVFSLLCTYDRPLRRAVRLKCRSLPTRRQRELYIETLIAMPTPGYLWLYM